MRRLLPPLRSFLGTGSQIGSIVRVLSHSIWSWVRQWRYKTGSADCLCWHFIFKSRQWFSPRPSSFWMFYIRKYSFLYFDISEDFICMLKWMYKWNFDFLIWKKGKFDVLFSPQIVCKCNRPCRFIQWEQKYQRTRF